MIIKRKMRLKHRGIRHPIKPDYSQLYIAMINDWRTMEDIHKFQHAVRNGKTPRLEVIAL